MTTITSLDLRNNYQEIGKKVHQGQSFSVTYRGNILFEIVPPANKNIENNKKVQPQTVGALLAKIKSFEPKIRSAESQKIYDMSVEETKEYARQGRTEKYNN